MGKKYYFAGFAPNYIKRELKPKLEKEYRGWGKDYFLTVVYKPSEEKDASGKCLYQVWIYKQINWFNVVGLDGVNELIDFLNNYENNQTINGKTTDTIKERKEEE